MLNVSKIKNQKSKIKNQKSKILFGFLSLIVFGASVANAVVIIVDPSDNQGWFIKNGSTGTGGLSTTQPDNHGGNGSFELITDGSNGQIIQVARVPIPLITVKNLTTVSWEFFSVAGEVPLAKIEYWSPNKSGTLVYDSSNESNGAGWQTADGFTGLWWSTEFGSADKRTLATWQATDVGDIPSNFFSVGIGSTSGAVPATTAYTDYIHLAGVSAVGSTPFDDTWNFEGDAAPPQLPIVNVSITKALDTAGPYTAGDTIQYTLTVANAGPDEAINTIVADIPTNLTISSVSSASCTELPCVIPSIANGASEVITVMATITAAGAFDNSAGAYAFVDSDLSDNVDNTGNGGTADPAPVVPPVPGPSKPIPTLSEWALILMSVLLGLAVIVRQRKLL